MNRPAHLIAGGLTSGATYLYLKNSMGEEPEWGEFFLFVGGGALVGALPDQLEPARSPHHRGFFHSVSFCVLSYLAYRKWVTKDLTDQKLNMALIAFGLAYGSHVVLDVTTPMGLPLLRQGC